MKPEKSQLCSALILAACATAAVSGAWADEPTVATSIKTTSLVLTNTSSTTTVRAAQSPPSPLPRHRILDLRAPDVRTVVPQSEWSTPLLMPEDDASSVPETVSVSGQSNSPEIYGGIASLWWGLVHPSQAWRIFTPVE